MPPKAYELKAKAQDQLHRLAVVKSTILSLLHPHLQPCDGIAQTLRSKLEETPPDHVSKTFAGEFAKAVDLEGIPSAAEFVAKVRACFDKELRAGKPGVVDLEIIFEDEAVNRKLVPAPPIRMFAQRCRDAGLTEDMKREIMAIVCRYQKTLATDRKFSFTPELLPVAAQRRLMLFTDKLPSKAAAGAVTANGASKAGQVRTRSPATTAAPAAHQQRRPQQPTPEPALGLPPPAPRGDDDDDDALFHSVMDAVGGTGGGDYRAPAKTATALEHNSHALANFIDDVSPVADEDDFDG